MPTISINNITYSIIDSKEKMTVPDSFVIRSNKIGTGSGEAKFYIGNDSSALREFWGNEGFNINCFLLKKDLLQYLKDSEIEYRKPEQLYRNREEMPQLWRDRNTKVNELNDVLWFNIKEETQIEKPRIYIKSDSENYKLIRELSLPFITYLSAIKLQQPNGEFVFYFRLFVDYFGETQHPFILRQQEEKIEIEKIPEEQKLQLRYARVGQGKYRKDVLSECPVCPITLVSDDRLLIASHIKPWVDSNEFEKIDLKNGFMFTPTYDFLFDRGFVTFTNDKKIKISPWISKMTCQKLNISDDKRYPMLPVEGREGYLQYHREEIFKI